MFSRKIHFTMYGLAENPMPIHSLENSDLPWTETLMESPDLVHLAMYWQSLSLQSSGYFHSPCSQLPGWNIQALKTNLGMKVIASSTRESYFLSPGVSILQLWELLNYSSNYDYVRAWTKILTKDLP